MNSKCNTRWNTCPLWLQYTHFTFCHHNGIVIITNIWEAFYMWKISTGVLNKYHDGANTTEKQIKSEK